MEVKFRKNFQTPSNSESLLSTPLVLVAFIAGRVIFTVRHDSGSR
jgi:hypothetical protein